MIYTENEKKHNINCEQYDASIVFFFASTVLKCKYKHKFDKHTWSKTCTSHLRSNR